MLQPVHLQQIVLLLFLVAAAISDIRKREVPNWVSYGLILAGLALGLLGSAVVLDWKPLAFSALGAGAAFAIAALMFYAGQWGGGDSKLLIGIGAMLGLPFALSSPFVSAESPLAAFLANLVLASFFYAASMAALLAVKNKRRFAAALKEQSRRYSLIRKAGLAAAAAGLLLVLLINDPLLKIGIAAILALGISCIYLSMAAKAVESACMLKQVSPLKLTEGDWIAKDVIIGGKRICGPKDLGIEKKQIRQLVSLYRRKRIRSVLIKEGIPFAPSFLIAYLVTVFFGNVFLTAFS